MGEARISHRSEDAPSIPCWTAIPLHSYPRSSFASVSGCLPFAANGKREAKSRGKEMPSLCVVPIDVVSTPLAVRTNDDPEAWVIQSLGGYTVVRQASTTNEWWKYCLHYRRAISGARGCQSPNDTILAGQSHTEWKCRPLDPCMPTCAHRLTVQSRSSGVAMVPSRWP